MRTLLSELQLPSKQTHRHINPLYMKGGKKLFAAFSIRHCQSMKKNHLKITRLLLSINTTLKTISDITKTAHVAEPFQWIWTARVCKLHTIKKKKIDNTISQKPKGKLRSRIGK